MYSSNASIWKQCTLRDRLLLANLVYLRLLWSVTYYTYARKLPTESNANLCTVRHTGLESVRSTRK
jgi:hypothetical protein